MLDGMVGRIDVHSHLLPGIDDGCEDIDESITCARRMVEAGYTHSFCTPHIWSNLCNNSETIAPRVQNLQKALDDAGVPMIVMPGGEMTINRAFPGQQACDFVTYNNAGKYAIFDFWTHEMPPFFAASVRHIQSAGIQPILAHPERIYAIQTEPRVVDEFPTLGLLIQCNLECLGDETRTPRLALAERWLLEDRYFLIGSDLHGADTLDKRLRGLQHAIDLVGEEQVWKLTHTNPLKLIEGRPPGAQAP
ncbi:MAG: hypothetical protein H7144_14045 [Burkholderiales bacterium]|nr:hypothetical protein [Phycisphaerae bacterium]